MYKTITMAVAVLALAGFGAAYAQTTTSTNSTTQQPMSKSGWHAKHMQHMQQRLTKLKAQLNITSQQAAAWDRFTRAAHNMWSGMGSHMKQPAASLTAPEVFDGMAQRAQKRALNAKALDEAADRLYGELSAKQKAAWNEAIAEMHSRMHHHMMHKMGKSHGMQGSVGGQG